MVLPTARAGIITGVMVAVTNLVGRKCTIDLGAMATGQPPLEIFSDSHYDPPEPGLGDVTLKPYGYRWIRLRP